MPGRILGINLKRKGYIYYTKLDLSGNIIEKDKVKIDCFNISDKKYIDNIINIRSSEM